MIHDKSEIGEVLPGINLERRSRPDNRNYLAVYIYIPGQEAVVFQVSQHGDDFPIRWQVAKQKFDEMRHRGCLWADSSPTPELLHG